MKNQKPSWLYSVITAKCPRCREANMFPPGTLYSTRFADMYKHCSCCGQSFEPEPGYYYGAMYVSFGFSTGIFLTVLFVLSLFVKELTLGMVMIAIAVIVIGLLPIMFRLSRSIWINIFIRYEGPCSQISRKPTFD
ncbi:MAG: DUF983 domain-containing protein [Bacteroidota bacterium]|nr:DUF983 domain-containing protein [Bacteroidota bacterium]